MALIDDMANLWKAERRGLRRRIALMESGQATTHTKSATSGQMMDTTSGTIADSKQHLAKIETMLARYPERI